MPESVRILLLERDPARAEVVSRALERAGWQCDTTLASSEREFRDRARRAFDVVIAGHGGGGFDAFAAARALAERGDPTPVIAVSSARGDEAVEAAERARESGLADFVCEDAWTRLGISVGRAIERRRLGESLRASERELARYRSFFAAGPVVVFRWVAAQGWPVEYVSPNVLQIFGVGAEDLTSGRVPYASLVHPDDLARVAEEVRTWSEKGVAGFDQQYRIVRPSGEVRWLFDHTLIARDAGGRITHYEGYVLDETERRTAQVEQEELQKKLLQTQKLESLGVLAGGIAHDFNNLLTSILGNAGLALQDLERQHPARDATVKTIQAAERAADLTRQLLAYAGQCAIEKRAIDVAAEVRQMSQLLQASIPKKVRLRMDLGTPVAPVEADPAQIQQVVMNLVINAAEACGDGPGNVSVSTATLDLTEDSAAKVATEPPLVPGRWVVIEVRDDGCGMGAATRARVFEPFFSTKFQGRGLGLWVVHGIVRAHDGRVHVESAPGQGSTFRVYLPSSQRPVPAAAPASIEDLSGHGLVLVIDDEPTVLHVASRVLRVHGYEVLTARDGQQGIEMFRARKDEIDLVLLDLTMPGMDGEEVLRAIRTADPDVDVIVASGYGENEVRSRFKERPPAGFLQKPYSVEGLAATVKRVMEQNAHAS